MADPAHWSVTENSQPGGSKIATTEPRSLAALRAAAAHRLSWPARVLVVDDDEPSRLLCATNLQLDGCHVLEAADGRQGIARALAELPDLIVTDVSMPDLDGFQFAEALLFHEETREIPLIFLSAETTPRNAERAEELGAVAYLVKPVAPTAVASLVASIVARPRSSAAAQPLRRRPAAAQGGRLDILAATGEAGS